MGMDLMASIKNELAGVEMGLDEDTLAVAGNANGSKRISIEAGVFRKFANGKEVAKVEDRHMNVIFVKMAHSPSRTYYAKAYKKGEKISPDCWSTDSKVPDEAVKSPKGVSCDKCPMSVKGSAASGQGSACRLSWRTAVVLPSDPSGDVLQLVLPAASVFGQEQNGKYPFRAYIQYLANNSVSAGRIITRMEFDTDASSPKLLFSPAAAVPPEAREAIMEQSQSISATNAVKLTVFQRQEEEDNGEFQKPVAIASEGVPEPVVRDTAKPPVVPSTPDMEATLKKWGKK